MKVFNKLEEIENIQETAVALGSFDGIHLGHQALIKRVVDAARERGLAPAVFTFSNHPRNVIRGDGSVKNILYKCEKEEILEKLGVEYLFDVPFTEDIMRLPKDRYVKELLLEKCRAKLVACGFNHKFGFKAEGDTDALMEFGRKLGFETIVMEPFTVNDNVVSSSLIRTLIASGRVDRCPEYMGRPYSVKGEVVVGNRLGRTLGFPTSNLIIDEEMVTPPNGVYVTYCTYNGKRYPSVTNVGVRPTVTRVEHSAALASGALAGGAAEGVTQGGASPDAKHAVKKNIETHIFDFDKELYGKTIMVEFLLKTRDEVKFDDLEDLKEQIVRDCKEAREYFD